MMTVALMVVITRGSLPIITYPTAKTDSIYFTHCQRPYATVEIAGRNEPRLLTRLGSGGSAFSGDRVVDSTRLTILTDNWPSAVLCNGTTDLLAA